MAQRNPTGGPSRRFDPQAREDRNYSEGYGPMNRDYEANGAYGQGGRERDHRDYGAGRPYQPPPNVPGGFGSYGKSSGSYEADRPDDDEFEPDYHQWRAEQMKKLDEDYRSWRNDRYRKFSEEFNSWRSERDKPTTEQGSQDKDPGKVVNKS